MDILRLRITEFMKAARIDCATLAARSGVDALVLDAFLGKQADLPTSALPPVATALGVSIDALFAFDGGYNFILPDEKLYCLPTVTYLLDLCRRARVDGLLGIREEVQASESRFLSTAFALIIDGCDPIVITEILDNMTHYRRYNRVERFRNQLIKVGALHIQNATDPRLLRQILYAFFEEDVASAYEDRTRAYSYLPDNHLMGLGDRGALPSCDLLEPLLADEVSPADIYEYIMHSSIETTAAALHGASAAVQRRFFALMSPMLGSHVVYDMDIMQELSAEEIREAQETLLQKCEYE